MAGTAAGTTIGSGRTAAAEIASGAALMTVADVADPLQAWQRDPAQRCSPDPGNNLYAALRTCISCYLHTGLDLCMLGTHIFVVLYRVFIFHKGPYWLPYVVLKAIVHPFT